MKPDVRLTAGQMRMIERAALALPPRERDSFMHSIVTRLSGEPSSAAVMTAINSAMDLRVLLFMTDAAPTPDSTPAKP